jgi:hypothetical protein
MEKTTACKETALIVHSMNFSGYLHSQLLRCKVTKNRQNTGTLLAYGFKQSHQTRACSMNRLLQNFNVMTNKEQFR